MPPFLLGDSYGDARMGLARILGFCFAFLFVSSVTAAEIIDLGPSDYRNWGTYNNTHTPSGLRSSMGQTVRLPPLNTSLNVTRNAVIPYGSIANGMRNFTRINPASAAASAAITALFLGLDWYFDEELDSWMKTDFQEVPPIEGTGFNVGFSCGIQPSLPAACQCIVDITSTYTSYTLDPPSACIMNTGTRVSFTNNIQCPAGSELIDGSCREVLPAPIGASDWAELEGSLPLSSPDTVGAAGHDVQQRIGNPLPGYHDTTITGPSSVSGPGATSTSTDPVTGDTVVTTSSTTTNINYGDTTITTTNTTVTNTYTNGEQTSSETTTETPGELPIDGGGGGGGGGIVDLPEFCDWATVVCDWLDWTREDPPPEQDLPAVIDGDFFEQKRISFGSKSCPPDHQIDLAPFLETTVGVSFQPLCDFAGLIYYMVMAASYIIAAYISIGVARNA